MFVAMALMDQQFPLVVTENLFQAKQVKETLKNKPYKITESENIKELLSQKEGLILFKLSSKNVKKICDLVSEIRLHGVAEVNGNKFQFPDYLKMMFVIDKTDFDLASAAVREKILYTFSPIYRF